MPTLCGRASLDPLGHGEPLNLPAHLGAGSLKVTPFCPPTHSPAMGTRNSAL